MSAPAKDSSAPLTADQAKLLIGAIRTLGVFGSQGFHAAVEGDNAKAQAILADPATRIYAHVDIIGGEGVLRYVLESPRHFAEPLIIRELQTMPMAPGSQRSN